MVKDLVIRSATPDDIEAAAMLGAQIVRLHHATNPKRFFLIDEVEQGYAWWLRQEVERAEAIVLVAELGGEIVGYAYGAIEERDFMLLGNIGKPLRFKFAARRRWSADTAGRTD